MFEENKGLIYGSKQEVVSEIENLLTPKSEELKAEDNYPQDKIVNGITFGIDIDDAMEYPSAVNAVQEAAIDYFTKQNNVTGDKIDYVIAYSDYITVASPKGQKANYKIAIAQTELLLEGGGSTGGTRYRLEPLNKAKDLNMEDPEDILLDISQIVEEYKTMGSKLTMADRLETLEKIIKKFEK